MTRNSHNSLKILFLSAFTAIFQPSHAQNNFSHLWDHRYGGTDAEELEVFFQTSDHGFVLAGTSDSDNDGNKSQTSRGDGDYYMVKTDADGLKLWDARFGGAAEDELTSAIQTSDGGYLLGGYSSSGISGDKSEPNWDQTTHNYNDYWIVKTDATGNKLWDKRFGGIFEDKLKSVIQTTDGGYLLGGYSESIAGGDKTEGTRGGPDFWIVKIDASGNKLWDKRFGGNRNEQLVSVIQTFDGNYVLGGFTWSDPVGDNTQSCRGPVNYCDYWIVKVDATGNKMWDKRYGGAANDNLVKMQECSDHGLILGGYSYSSTSGEKSENNYGAANTADYWMVRTDAMGNKLWDKTIGGNMNEEEMESIAQTSDGGFLLSGASYSGVNGDKTEVNLGPEQGWVVKTDENGAVKWDKTIFTPGHDESGIALMLNDGSLVFANTANGSVGGYKTEDNHDASHITYDMWILKLQNAVLPISDFTMASQFVCSKTCVDFQDQSINANSYHWIFQGGVPSTSTAQNPTNICYNAPGVFNVTLITENNFGTDTLVMPNYVHVLQAPAAIQITRSFDTLSVPQGYASYEWFLNGQSLPNSNSYFYVASLGGNYSVTAFNQFGCTTNADLNDVISGVDHVNSTAATAFVFPNPAQDNFVINYRFTQYEKKVTIEIYDAISKLVFRDEVNNTADEMHYIVDSSKLKSGLYRVSIKNGVEQVTKNIVIEKSR